MVKKAKSHGGKRPGAGRPSGSGKYGEPTLSLRVPSRLAAPLKAWLNHYPGKNPLPSSILEAVQTHPQALPFFDQKIAAGFPSPADNPSAQQLDLNAHLIKNPATTFYVQVQGDSMINAGIYPNDLLVVDRSLKAVSGNIVIAFVEGEFTVKRLKILPDQQILLMPENENYAPLVIKGSMEFSVWGVVRAVVHAVL